MLKKYSWDLFAITCLFLLTFTVYLYQIEHLTPGAYGDEITIGQAAQELLTQPNWIAFVPVNLGHATPLLYLTGWLLQATGPSLLTLRLVSVVFGVASTMMAYLLARQWWSMPTAWAVSLMLGLSYPMLILSRLAYEMTAALFFFLASYLLLRLYQNHSNIHHSSTTQRRWLILGTGLMIGAGLSTYLGFRLLAVGLVGLALGQIGWNAFRIHRQTHKQRRSVWALEVALLGVGIVMTAAPILLYAIHQPTLFWQRTATVSVFHQELPPREVVTELAASSANTLAMFWRGDPNYRHNPTGRPMFDYVSTALMTVGLITLLRQKRTRAFGALTLLFACFTLLNDILTIEIIPDFRYYGQGHPNTLRIFAVIPFVYLWVGFGLGWLQSFFTDQRYYLTALFTLVCLSLGFNLTWYFAQDRQTIAGEYIYLVNHVLAVEAAQATHRLPRDTQVFVSSTLEKSPHFAFLRQPKIEVAPLIAAPAPDELSTHQTMWIVAYDEPELVTQLYQEFVSGQASFTLDFYYNPRGEIELLRIVPRNT